MVFPIDSTVLFFHIFHIYIFFFTYIFQSNYMKSLLDASLQWVSHAFFAPLFLLFCTLKSLRRSNPSIKRVT